MHRSTGRLWLIAGTGEGPPLAEALVGAGWRLRVSVVTQAAARAYAARPGLEIAVGAIGVRQPGVSDQLRAAAAAGDPFRWVIDASHPFAMAIRGDLSDSCRQLQQPLLRLERPRPDPAPFEQTLGDLAELQGCCRPGEHLLLAIGARHLAEACRRSAPALHHARILPRPEALRLALAAGLPAERVALLQPRPQGPEGTPLERALCRRWRIETILCRGSGGPPELQWRRVAAELGLRLLLLQRPQGAGTHAEVLGYEALLRRLGVGPSAD
ncbi:MAG: precorrin-6A/cobalt-precorrin-6A reductase [Synechococcaceae cyanobacterium]|nr:precorrin-6A/cobalt-precorrin-6A reductase [Synechococcaceae cyanobacterium]